MTIEAGEAIWAVRCLIEVQTRALDEDLSGALQGVVDRLSEVLSARSVAVCLKRSAWDDFELVAAHEPEDGHAPCSGTTMTRGAIEAMFDASHEVEGAWFVPRHELPGEPAEPSSEMLLIVPIRSPAGELIGLLSIDGPYTRAEARGSEVRVAVAIADAAAAAVRGAQRALEARKGQRSLELLFELSAGLAEDHDIDKALLDCCDGIQRALGFECVAIELADPGVNELRMRASVGWEGVQAGGVSSVADIERLRDPDHEIEGCYLWTADEAIGRVGEGARRYSSRRNGVGPLAWDHHWLIVPLTDAGGRVRGWVWVDDPEDHLLPTRETLRILRTFANQAMAAVTDAMHVDQLRAQARLDSLTGALNRRAIFEQLDTELARAARSESSVTLVLFDLDRFKDLNDTHGHPAGDAVLRTFARVLERNVRAHDAVGRVGGDEFALVLVDVSPAGAEHVLERVSKTIERDPVALGEVEASAGVARSPEDGRSRDELFAVADARLYEEKRRRARPPISLVDER